jgi:uncharacterized protein (DUF1501 family)
MIDRRQFLGLVGGVTVVGLAACTDRSGSDVSVSRPTTPSTSLSPDTTTGHGGTALGGSPSRRVLVIVQLNGGNDGLNTVIPSAGQYHDLRPTLAIPEANRVALTGRTDLALHPSLAPLGALWTAGKLAIVESVGFPDQNHSHFVAMDQWWRADDPTSATGWLGTYLATLPSTDPLYATALNSSAPQLLNAVNPATVLFRPAAFTFGKQFDERALAAMASPRSSDPLRAAAQAALARSVVAVDDFAHSLQGDTTTDATIGATAGTTSDTTPPAEQQREGGVTLADGLATAAKLIANDPNTRIVVVSASGFDTHANQLATQETLLGDLATGLDAFMTAMAHAGRADDVLVVTTSEFGRRAAENGSGGTDHGTGNVAFVLGTKIAAGVHGEVDLTNLANGDVRATIDPRSIYTACLDWLGADASAILGKRYEDVALLA